MVRLSHFLALTLLMGYQVNSLDLMPSGRVFASEDKNPTGRVPTVGSLLRAGKLKVDVMDLAAPPRAQELAQRLIQATQKDPAWWLEHVKKAKPGQPLPYDAKMGMSEKEYREFLSLANQIVMVKVGVADLAIRAEVNGRLALEGGDALPELTGIIIDLTKDQVTTPFGLADQRSEITASTNQKATGPWNGIQWKYEKANLAKLEGTVVKLAVGKLVESGRGILYYDVKHLEGDNPKKFYRVLTFELPKE